jgi:hypothetical protein
LGEKKFNERFKNKKIKISTAAADTPSRKPTGSGILPGDWVYFSNVPEYDQMFKDPRDLWRGENAAYEGDEQYSGFGIPSTTDREMRKNLLNQYNKRVPAAQQKNLDDVPDPDVLGVPDPTYGEK